MKTWHKIIIAIGILVLTSAGTVGAMYLIQQAHPKANTSDETPDDRKDKSSGFQVDTSKDYGACTLVEQSIITEALGPLAASLQEKVNIGRIQNAARGEAGKTVAPDTQACVYAFVPGGTLENIFNSNNGLTVSAGVFASQQDATLAATLIQEDEGMRPVEALGDAAFLSGPTPSTGNTGVTALTVIDGTHQYQYRISQPTESPVLTDAQVEAALITIAKSVKE